LFHGPTDLIDRRALLQGNEYRLGMPIHHVDPGAGAAEPDIGRPDNAFAEAPQDLAALDLDPLFFIGNIWNDVVEDVHAQDAAIATGAGHRLHRGHDHLVDAEAVHQRAQG